MTKDKIYDKHYKIAVSKYGSGNNQCIYDAMQEYAHQETDSYMKYLADSIEIVRIEQSKIARDKSVAPEDDSVWLKSRLIMDDIDTAKLFFKEKLGIDLTYKNDNI